MSKSNPGPKWVWNNIKHEERKNRQTESLVTSRTLRLKTLVKAGRLTFNVMKTLTWRRMGERWIHGVVLGILEVKVGDMQYEYPVSRGRIDMRHGSSNPGAIELVVVTKGSEWHASQNKTELDKLTRVPNSHRRRVLLILHPYGDPVPKERMRDNYSNWTAGQGRFQRHTVTVQYVHPKLDYNFRWYP